MKESKIKFDNGNSLILYPIGVTRKAQISLLDNKDRAVTIQEYETDEEAEQVFCIYASNYYEAKANFIASQSI